jgi:palmitoyltransferase
VQYSWPPRDPQWQPELAHDPQGSPFIYGDGFNPALRPSNAGSRSRGFGAGAACLAVAEEEIGGRSSPEPEYSEDDDDDLPLAYSSSRVRRGSEGWEVRPAPGWAAPQMFAPTPVRPWERPGRYNVYTPEDE